MSTELVTRAMPTSLAYLRAIADLDDEVQVAMGAIGANALATLEESVSRQQTLCAELQRLAGAQRGPAAKADPAALSQADASLGQRIRLAGESLAALNLRYAALLQHSGRSVRLFSSLCRGYTQQF